MKKIRRNLYLISFFAAIFATYLSFEYEYRTVSRGDTSSFSLDEPVPVAVSNTIDSGLDGGAAGFATLSGLALVAASITYLKEEDLNEQEDHS
jgi:hypothetical protein